MNHLSDEQLVDVFYRDGLAGDDQHTRTCAECRGRFLALQEALDAIGKCPAPDRADDYGREVWRRLAPQLAGLRKRRIPSWLLVPIAAALIGVAFLAGIWTEQKRVRDGAIDNARSRERVLLMTMSDHLERSQVVLAELLHADPGSINAADTGERARNLVEENRLLRDTALHLGDRSRAALLDDLERVLLTLANGGANGSPQDFRSLQQRVEQQGLLWKVRMTSNNARQKGRTL